MGKTILVVDDSASMRQVVSMALKGGGFEVIEACDGKDALAKLMGQKSASGDQRRQHAQHGWHHLRQGNEKERRLPFVPVIMLTTEGNEEKKKAGQEAGAKAWVVKPFQPQQMLAAVSRLLMM
jgi:two-component system chemotaxis response regulator CheY